MLRALRPFFTYKFSLYTESLQKYKTLTTIDKTQFKVNKNVTFYGIPLLSEDVANSLVATASSVESPTVIFMSDCSQNLLINSRITDDIFKEKFYKDVVEGKQLATTGSVNMELPNHVRECYVIPNLFFEDVWREEGNEDEELNLDTETYVKIKDKLCDQYGMDPYYSIPATMVLFANPESLCLAGMSELWMRRCLADTYPLEIIKQAFLNMAELVRDLKKNTEEPYNQLSANKAILFELRESFPDVMIGKEAEQLFYLLHQLEEDCVVFADTPILDRVQELVKLCTPELIYQIKQEKSLRKLVSYPPSADQDQVQLQKHAILETILSTDLWSKRHVFNRFPYLKVKYPELLAQQQQSIKERYLHHLNRYKSAWAKLTE